MRACAKGSITRRWGRSRGWICGGRKLRHLFERGRGKGRRGLVRLVRWKMVWGKRKGECTVLVTCAVVD